MGGIGLDAQVIAGADREAKKKLGVLAYFVSALKNLPRRRQRVEITLDDHRPLRRRVKTVMIANMGKITGGLEAVPTASPNDGRLDVAILRTETLAQWLRLLGYALRGRAHEDPALDVYPGAQGRHPHTRPAAGAVRRRGGRERRGSWWWRSCRRPCESWCRGRPRRPRRRRDSRHDRAGQWGRGGTSWCRPCSCWSC